MKTFYVIVSVVVVALLGVIAMPKSVSLGSSNNVVNTSTQTAVSVPATSTLVMAASSGRQYAILTNVGAQTAWLSFGKAITATTTLTPLLANGQYIITLDNEYTGAIYAYGNATTTINTANFTQTF